MQRSVVGRECRAVKYDLDDRIWISFVKNCLGKKSENFSAQKPISLVTPYYMEFGETVFPARPGVMVLARDWISWRSLRRAFQTALAQAGGTTKTAAANTTIQPHTH